MNRNASLDTLRTLAALLVVILHIASGYVLQGIYTANFDSHFQLANYVDAFTRICVPLFVMLSGRFVLAKAIPWQDAMRNLFSRIIVPLLFWNLLYFIYTLLANYYSYGNTQWESVLTYTSTGQAFYHLWYLTMSVGLYLVAPYLAKRLQTMSLTQAATLSAAFITIGMLIDFSENYFHYKLFFALNFVKYLGYFLAAFVLKDIRKIPALLLFAIYFIASIAIAKTASITVLHGGNLYPYDYLSPLVVIASLAIFKLFLQVELTTNFFSNFAPLTFGIYLVHAMPLDILNRYLDKHPYEIFQHSLIGMSLQLVLLLPLSYLIVILFRRIPFLERMI